MKLIDKDALVAEIERRKKYFENIQMIKPVYESNIEDFNELLSFLDTLEVKEVDLKDEASIRDELLKYLGSYSSRDFAIAKHFFELGLKVAQKGE